MHRTAAALLFALAALPSLAAVTGTVMTPDGTPVAGARVSIYAVESPEARRARLLSDKPEPVPLFTAQADARGGFSLESPKDPVADLRVSAAGYDPTARRIERDEEAGAVVLFKSETKHGVIRGGGKPVAGATVVLSYSGVDYITKTDDQGKYDAPDPKRARSITVIHPSWAIDEELFMTSGPASALNRTLTTGTAITGRVLGSDGTTPAGKATITVDAWPLATSGDDGTFTVAHAPAKWTSVIAQSGQLMAMRAQGSDKSLMLKLSKSSTITGRVTDSKSKLPVAGALVSVGTRAGRMMLSGTWGAFTDAKGNYSIALPSGTYFAMASHPAYNINPLDVSVAAGQTVARDFPATPLARVSGVVMSEDRKPVAAANITPEEVSEDLGRMGMRMFMREASTFSGPDGKFTARISNDSEIRMRAARKGFPVAKSEAFRVAPGDRKSGVVITVPNGIAVTGKVTDREGKPLSGVAVAATEAAAGRGGMIRQVISIGGPQSEEEPVRSGSDGSFTIRVKEGTYDFSFRRDGYSTKLVRGQTIAASGAPVPIEVSLDTAVDITGRVVRNGTGVDGVNINTFSEMGMGPSAVSGPDGSFTLSGLTPGEVRASLRKESDFIQEMRSMTAPSHDVLIELPSGSRVTGRVIDKESRKPVTSFQAGISTSRSGGGMVMMAPPQLKNFTSDDGTFTLENIPSGGVNLIASAPGYAQARMNVTVEEGKPLSNIELELDPGTKLVGKVTDPSGAALSGATVRVVPSGAALVLPGGGKQTVTDSNGEYTLDALEASDTNVEVSHAKYLGTRKEITPKGREVRLDVQLTAGQRITGVVVTEAGAPVPDAEVEAIAGAGTFRTARTDTNGQFSFDSLAAARYRFIASKHGYSEGRLEDFDISSGAPVRLVLKSGATLYGAVRGLAADELQATTVEARGSDGAMSSATVDSAGNYRLEGSPTGTVRVSAVVMRNFANRKTSSPQTVTIAAGESQHIDLEFHSDTVIRGRVTRNHRPLSSASVNFTPKRGSSTQTSGSASTDEQGNYSVTGLEPGEYNVYVMDMQRFSPYTTTYEVRGSSTFDIDYSASALRGRVLDAGTGDPIDDARVTIRSTTSEGAFRGDRVAASDVNGTFTLDSVAPGTYTVSADKSGFGNTVTEVTVTDAAPQEMELRLSKNPGVILKVVDARDGRALNAIVYVYDSTGRFVQDSGMRFGGDVESASDVKLSLGAGSYSATVLAMGYAPVTVNFVSPATQTVALTPGGKIVLRSSRSERQRVRLVDANGNLYPRSPNRPTAMDLPGNPAEIPLSNIAPGSYSVQVLTNNDMTVTKSIPVVVTEGGSVDVDV